MGVIEDTPNYRTIRVAEHRGVITIQLFRPEFDNSINDILINEILNVLTNAEQNKSIKVIILEGNDRVFCTGMDFNAVNSVNANSGINNNPNDYYNMLKFITSCSKIIITKVKGKVNAGGIGLIASSDIVLADDNATFSLSEALFGLLPACVMPFLIRRIGFQKAQWMALTTQYISCQRAYQIGLVDEKGSDINDLIRRNLIRLNRLETQTIMDLKDYMSKLWIINDKTQELAVNRITTLLNSERIQDNINNFVQKNRFPWQK
ncbi:enoyl-CoA hydratase/isomerase [Aquimarina sp. RZ0]|uniref:enoyl-CoA hydratase/isomerase n=1 Tax=Aquimarina sp. RZ0 TaxID=2607730 RepID=UPI0011F229D4|nr:enoyl-CoA hydratase/isomerase [Aquimarina sp. RZ0]KAA1246063.1 enoyl-CoA hydratase/isomerase [Aquimarina sp. RZ0]